MKCKTFFSAFFFLFFVFALQAQQTRFTEEDSLYFSSQLPELHTWLDEKGLTDVLDTSKSQIRIYYPEGQPYLALYLRINTAAQWLGAVKAFSSVNEGTDVRRQIFRKFSFLAGVPRRSTLVYVFSNEITPYKERFGLHQGTGELLVQLDTVRTKSVPSTNYSVPKSIFPVTETEHIEGRFREVRQKIRNIFDDYYQGKGSWFTDATVSPLAEEKTVIELEITNIKNEVIDDCLICYFERIRILIDLKDTGGKISFSCQVDGAYGPGVFRGPRRTEYSPIDKDYVMRYAQKIKLKLKEKLQISSK